MIYISRTRLPKFEDYVDKIKKIWETNWLTNNGEYVQELEQKLQDFWGVKNVVCVDHGTSAIMIALKSLDVKEVYVSPLNFAPTVTAALWLNIKTNFVDLNENYGNPALVTHLYGIPNIVDSSPVIYDASHSFATKVNDKYLVSYGDVSVVSFHAVKIFQTIEGGAVVTNNDNIAEKARWMRNFGFNGRYSFHGVGVNMKMSEFHAAMGLLSLEMIPESVKKYQHLISRYNKAFNFDYKAITYYPIKYKDEKSLLKAIDVFEKEKIFVRRYFYPPLNRVFGGKKCPLAEEFMSRVLCVPLYYELKDSEQDNIIKIAKKTNELLK